MIFVKTWRIQIHQDKLIRTPLRISAVKNHPFRLGVQYARFFRVNRCRWRWCQLVQQLLEKKELQENPAVNTNPKVTNLCILLNVCFWNLFWGELFVFIFGKCCFLFLLLSYCLCPVFCCFCMFLLLFAFTTFSSFLFFCFSVFRVFLLSLLFAVYFSFFCCFFCRCHKRHLKNKSQIKADSQNNLVLFFLRGLPFDIFAGVCRSFSLFFWCSLSLSPSFSKFDICHLSFSLHTLVSHQPGLTGKSVVEARGFSSS